MSGIYGYYIKSKQNIDQYSNALSYWNRDYGKNVLTYQKDDPLFLGVNLEHLSSKVPVQTSFIETNRYLAVIDAVIYNREELISYFNHAQKNPQSIKTSANVLSDLSDELLIFHLLTQKADIDLNILKQINGDFAGVIYDKLSKLMYLFRDHMGIRPLFYYQDDEQFIFSTDIRGLLACPNLKISVNEKHLYETLTYNIVTTEDDLAYEGINMVRRASYQKIDCSNTVITKSEPQRYWILGQHKIKLKDEPSYQKELRRLIEESVKRRMDAVDGLIGAELSGGLDSSVISILIHRLGREGRYFSWSESPEKLPIIAPNDERNIIAAICKQEGFDVQYNFSWDDKDVIVNSEHKTNPDNDTASHFEDTNDYNDSIANKINPPYINTTDISKGSYWFHQQGVKAVFTGHGGDEGVSHRCNIREIWYHKEYLEYIKAIHRQKEGLKLKWLRTAKTVLQNVLLEYPKLKKIHNESIALSEYLNPEYKNRMKSVKEMPFTFSYDAIDYIGHGYTNNRTNNTAFQAAKYGVRYMFPFLDYHVIDYAVSIPRYLYHNGVQNRRIYIEAFRDMVPEELLRYFSKRTISMDRPSEGKKHEVTEEDFRKVVEEKNKLIDTLDPEIWNRYFELDQLKCYTITKNSDSEEIQAFRMKCHLLSYCRILQYTWQHAADPINIKD